MPVLSRRPGVPANGNEAAPAANRGAGGRLAWAGAFEQVEPSVPAFRRRGLLETCANPGCGSGWMHLWRNRTAPVFEGGWNCSAACTEARMAQAVRRELGERAGAKPGHRHRIPLGLVMLEQGWITAGQLRRALDAQRVAASGRLGWWLVRQQGVSEDLVTRALGLQWSCPVLPLESHDPEALASMLPRLFVEAFGAIPLRVAAGRLVYLGFEHRLDPVLALALERMSGLRVECGLGQGSLFAPAFARHLKAAFPECQLLEAFSEAALARALAGAVERVRPVQSRLVRVHGWLWLRMWRRPPQGPVAERDRIADVIATVAPS